MDCAEAGVKLQSSEWSWGHRVRQANDKETGKLKMVENAIKRMKQGEVIEIGGMGGGDIRETFGGGGVTLKLRC